LKDARAGRADLTSFSQFVQEVIGGAVRRHTFTEWELELLLDLETCTIRKSARADLLRRYLKAVHREFVEGAASPLRFSSFLERRKQRRRVACGGPSRLRAVHAARAM
jgi:hypothetical protein